jgi:hypothetical protein
VRKLVAEARVTTIHEERCDEDDEYYWVTEVLEVEVISNGDYWDSIDDLIDRFELPEAFGEYNIKVFDDGTFTKEEL